MAKAIIFDLGNVLLPIDLGLTYEAFAAYSSLSAVEIEKKILENQLWVPYESGLQSDEEFRVFLREHLSLNCTDLEFDEAFSALLLDFHQGVYDWVESLTSFFQLYLLSNTSSIHAKRFTQVKLGPEGQNFFSLFDRVYFSFEMGLVKPNPLIYQQVLEENSLNASDALFFDDNVANINSANLLGIQSFLVDPSQDLHQIQQIINRYVS
ncbi:MAG: HAD family phosphatase [Cytophagales bacterium]|nr:HAD family phosphatase [Cytophagales bacterium]